jgi:IS1 family transposase/lambda repressor-like predicted transcriptional regulator
MYTSLERAVQVLQLLVEGCSVRSTERITGMHRDTVLRVLSVARERCERVMTERVRNVRVRDVQCDEIWGYIFKKEAHKSPEEAKNEAIGDAYCFIALERHTKLVLAWHLGRRDRIACEDFISKLRWATSDQWFQVTTDGFQPYIGAIDAGLSDRVDYAQLVKVYASAREGEARYSPPEVVDAVPIPIFGNPDPKRICSSHIERGNLTMRMQIRRLTRLTNAFSKKWENLKAALALHFCWYNMCRVHSSLRVTPAMEAGITDHIWNLGELLA